MRKSMIKKLLLLYIGTQIIAMSAVLIISNRNLRSIINESQSQLYKDKLEAIWFELMLYEEKLDRTGLRDAYLEDFQESALRIFEKTYYGDNLKEAYPFFIDTNWNIVLHPNQPVGSNIRDDFALWTDINPEEKSGEFYSTYRGQKKWYAYRYFESWDWVLCYTIPLSVKYKDLYSFRNIQIGVILAFSLFLILIMTLVLVRLFKPVKALTAAAQIMANGDWSDEILATRKDELGILANSFNAMQHSIRDKMDDLTKARGYISDIIDSMPSAIISLDRDCRITQMNHLARDLLNVSRDRLKATSLWEIFKPIKEVEENIIKSVSEGNIYRRSSMGLGDSIRVYDIVMYPLEKEADGGAVLRIDDVTQKKKLEDQMAQIQKMDALGQLVGGVAHDFNNMLGGIMAAAELLEVSLPKEGNYRDLLNMILDASGRASDLVANLLSFSRKSESRHTSEDLHSIIYQTVSILKRTLDRKIDISVEAKADSPVFNGSPAKIENLIMNIAINASHAMPEGGLLSISTRNVFLDDYYCTLSPFDISPGQYIEMEIRDTGTGIPPDAVDKIFEPFFTTKETGKGTGLGLASVHGTVQEHKGVIQVYSELGTGTVFHVSFPCNEKTIPSDRKKEVSWQGTGTILLVDDEEIIRRTAQMILTEMGLTVYSACDGVEALDVFKKKGDKIDLVITDMIMPRMEGRELVREIKKARPDMRIVVSSGYTRNDDLKKMEESGIEGFIQKPFTRSELTLLMKSILSE